MAFMRGKRFDSWCAALFLGVDLLCKKINGTSESQRNPETHLPEKRNGRRLHKSTSQILDRDFVPARGKSGSYSLRASLRWSCYLKHVMRKFDTFQLRSSDCRGLISVWWWWVWNVSVRVVLTTTVNESCNNTWVYAVDSALRWKKWRS